MFAGKKGLILLIILGLGPGALPAAEYGATVPVELLAPLTQAGRFYRGLPPGFPLRDLPAGLSVIGAMDKELQQPVLLRSEPEGAVARTALLRALEAQGWREQGGMSRPRRGGFIVPDLGEQELTLCHDSGGLLYLRGETAVENRAYLLHRKPPSGQRSSCEERFAGSPAETFPAPGLSRYLPAFDFPSPNLPPGASAVGMRGVGNVGIVRSGATGLETVFEGRQADATSVDIARRQAAQLAAEGWRLDADWSSPAAAGAVWLLSAEDGLNLVLSITVEEVEEDHFSIRVRLNELE